MRTMQNPQQKTCVPCRGGARKLSETAINQALKSHALWQLSADKTSIMRRIKCKNFVQALALVNEVGSIAEHEQHHPDIAFGWSYAAFTMTTHDVGGLHNNDFIMAAHIDRLAQAAGLA